MRPLYSKVWNKLYNKLIDKAEDVLLGILIGQLIYYAKRWNWSQTRVQEMRRKFHGILLMAESLINTIAQQSNTANSQVQQLLRQLKVAARRGKELLDGQNLMNAREWFERIQVIIRELQHLQGCKEPQFKPRYLQRRTRLQVIRLKGLDTRI